MRTPPSLLRRPGVWLILVLTAGVCLFAGLAVQDEIFPTVLLEDPIALGNYFLSEQHTQHQWDGDPFRMPPLSGAVTYLGVMLMCSGGAISLFAASIGLLQGAGSIRIGSRYLLFSGLLTLLIAADDLFMIHETVPYFDSDIIYSLILALLILSYWRWIATQLTSAFVIALAFWGISAVLDSFGPVSEQVQTAAILEEGSKFLGYLAWIYFHCHAALGICRQVQVGQDPDDRNATAS